MCGSRSHPRIPRIYSWEYVNDKLNKIWKQYPDWRFFQLLCNIGFDFRQDYFYVEDDKLIEILNKVERQIEQI